MNYFEIRLVEMSTDQKGRDRVGSKSYIVGIKDSSLTTETSFTIANDYIWNEVGSRIVRVQSIKEIDPDMILNLTDPRDDLSYYRCQVLYLEENDTTGKIKKVRRNSYVLAKDITEVKELVQTELKTCIHEYYIPSVNKIGISDILIEK